MSTPSSQRTVLITGSNTGIGFGVAGLLAKTEGYHVIMGGRTDEKTTSAYEKHLASGISSESLFAITLDVTSDEHIANAVEFVEKKFGKLDILINNAGIHGITSFADSTTPTRPQLLENFNTNAASAALMIEAFHHLLLKSDDAYVWNISSSLGSLSSMNDPSFYAHSYDFLPYTMSKAALNMVTVMYAKRYKDTPIKVNSYSPKYTATALNFFLGMTPIEEAIRDYTKRVVDGIEERAVFDTPEGRYGW